MAAFAPGEMLAPLRIGPITAGRVEAFAQASGDRNPIHVDAAAARRAGLEAAPVPGMQLVAFMHEAVSRSRPGVAITALSTRFLAPVAVGDSVEISGRIVKVDAAGAVMRLFLRDGSGALASVGEATLVPAVP
ncbi:MaoC family dehydratase [Labrys wisconsinensis]|uniref:Acyl dehydratase n=1 Tax=Labrys wisconsinensis TaxID=425677 RepID=A0ABU0IZ21_9HYPH|nr:MaoC family dehydratase [Labrys wisconsinensis]MDQ0467258.1 acyl dehydratase [Labrys wisconsinensis]